MDNVAVTAYLSVGNMGLHDIPVSRNSALEL